MATPERPVRPDPVIRQRDPLAQVDGALAIALGLLVAILLLAVLV